MVLQRHEHQPRPHGLVRIRPSSWCRERLRAVAPGVLSTSDEDARTNLRVLCAAEHHDLVFVVLGDVSRTWSLVWAEVSIEVTGPGPDGQRWVVRVHGSCERDRVPLWAAERGPRTDDPAAAGHPAGSGRSAVPGPPIGLRLRDAAVRGYSVSPEQQAAG